MDSNNYTSTQIITYMGNKRKLLSFIEDVLNNIQSDMGGIKLNIGDGFSGSGIVSRLFKKYAKNLYVNDLAGYSSTLNKCYLANPTANLQRQINKHIDMANSLADDHNALSPQNAWVSKHWAPNKPDIANGERTYFTYENGRRIDVIRDYIETIPIKLREFPLATLLVETSIHNNTNGNFAAYYKDGNDKGAYGGKIASILNVLHNRSSCHIQSFPKINAKFTLVKWTRMIGPKTVSTNNTELDVVYYDPPYNKHPYNIYYFLLDIINEWDKTIEIPPNYRGQPAERTKSKYNSIIHAKSAMDDLMSNTKSRYVILSYNNGGIIPITELDELLAKYASKVDKIPIDHKTYNRLKGLSNYKRTAASKDVKEFLYVMKMK